jgi:large subunit ribosomal protein L21
MYAVIKIGGKQYRVEQGQKLLVDRQPHAAGEAFTPDVLMTGGDEVVTDRAKLEGSVSVQVVEHLRGEKIKVFTFKPKRGFKKTRGHRSELTRISVETIGATRPKRAPASKAEAEPAAAAQAPEAEAKAPARAPAKPRAAAKPKAEKADAPATRPRRTRAKKEDTGDGA